MLLSTNELLALVQNAETLADEMEATGDSLPSVNSCNLAASMLRRFSMEARERERLANETIDEVISEILAEEEDKARHERLKHAVRMLLNDLPARRDWLDPALEATLKMLSK
jgi:hypothetical protein